MAVTVIERWQGRGASTDEKGVRTLKRQWNVETDADGTGEPAVVDAVIAADASAALYSSHPHWPAALCRDLTAQPNGGPRVWLVDAAYSTAAFQAIGDGGASGTGAGGGSAPSPATSTQTQADQRPPTITVARKEITKVLERDAVTGAKVTNTIGDPFDPLPEVFRSHHLITFKFFRTPAQLSWGLRSQWMDSINAAAVVILGKRYPAYSLRCVDYALDTVWDTGPAGLSFFFQITAQAEYDPDLWLPKILNTGRRRKVGDHAEAGAILVGIVDANGQPVADPVPLTAAGVPVAVGDPYHYVEPNGYVPYNWNGAGGTIFGNGGFCG